MNKQNNNLDEKELLKRVEDLIDGKTSNQKFTNSFLGFCSRLFSVRPKTDAGFQLSLRRELLKEHSANLEKEVELRKSNKIKNSLISIKEFMSMTKVKRTALIGVPATLLIAFAVIFTSVINPIIQEAKAMEIVAQDPQVRSVIEEYNLNVQKVITKGDTAYIILDTTERVNYIITVDLDDGTVGRIVKGENGIRPKDRFFEEKASDMDMTVEEFRVHLKERYEAKAESMGMTSGEFKEYLIQQKKGRGARDFKEKAERMGLTVEELKQKMVERFEQSAEEQGMTVGEFKMHLKEQKKAFYENFKAEAEAKGMTEAEYKEYLEGLKK